MLSILRASSVGTVNWRVVSARLAAAVILLTVVAVRPVPAAPIGDGPIVAIRKPTKERPQEVLDAMDCFQTGDVDKTYKLLVKAAEKHAHLPPPRVMLANLCLSDTSGNRVPQGRAYLEQAVLDYPADPEPHLSFGDLALREGRLTDAAANYASAAERLKTFKGDEGRRKALQGRYVSGMAGVAEGRAQWDKAVEWLTALMKLRTQDVPTIQRMGSALFWQGKVDDAYKQFAEAVKLDPAMHPAPLSIAGLFRQQGKLEDSAKWLERAAKELPKDSRPQSALARFYFDSGDLAKAESYSKVAEKIDPESLDVRVLRGTVARFRKDFRGAEQYLEAAHERVPGSVAVSNQLALTWADQGNKEKLQKALALATATIKSNSDSTSVTTEMASTLGWIYHQLGMDDDAIRSFEHATAAASVSRDTAYYLARVRFKQGNLKGAQELLQGALDSAGPFANLDDAQRWSKQLAKQSK